MSHDDAAPHRVPLFQIAPLVYGTVILLAVTSVAMDEHVEDHGDAVSIVLGPMIATAFAHLFASFLGDISHRGRLPDAAETRHHLWHAAQFLILAVVPLLLVAIGRAGLWSADTALDIASDIGLVFLIVIGAVSGRRVTSNRWLGAVAGGVMAVATGIVITVMKLILEHH